MNAVIAAVVMSLALGAGKEAARPAGTRTEWDAKNAARARVGLLPRKAPKVATPARDGRRIVPIGTSAPTYLGEPVPVVYEEAVVAERNDAGAGVRASAGSVDTDVTIVLRYDD